MTWYTGGLPEATGVRLRLPNSHALLSSGRPWNTTLISPDFQTLLFGKFLVDVCSILAEIWLVLRVRFGFTGARHDTPRSVVHPASCTGSATARNYVFTLHRQEIIEGPPLRHGYCDMVETGWPSFVWPSLALSLCLRRNTTTSGRIAYTAQRRPGVICNTC